MFSYMCPTNVGSRWTPRVGYAYSCNKCQILRLINSMMHLDKEMIFNWDLEFDEG